jgi:chaperonin cofactor prefoldin
MAQQPNDAYLQETFKERLQLKLKMAILSMRKSTITKMVNSTKMVEQELHSTRKYMVKN